MTELLRETFDAVTVGTDPAGWTDADSLYSVQTAPAGLTGRVYQTAQAPADHFVVSPTFTRNTSGYLQARIIFKTGANTSSNWGAFMMYDGTKFVWQVVPNSSGNFYFTGTSSTALFTYTSNTVYDVTVTHDLSGKKAKLEVNGVTYDNSGSWYDCQNASGGLYPDRFKIDNYSPSGTASINLDHIEVDSGLWTTRTLTADSIVIPNTGRTLTADAVISNTPLRTVTADAQVALPVGTIHSSGTHSSVACGCDKYSVVTLVYEGQGGTKTIERSPDGSSWSDVTSAGHVVVTTISGDTVQIVDRRPQYGSGATTFGGNVYYRVRETSGGVTGQNATTAAIVADVDKTAVETTFVANLSSIMGGSHIAAGSSPSEDYPSYPMLAMAYGYYLTGTAQYLTDCMTQFDYIKTLENADKLIIFPQYPSYIYRDFHGRTIAHAVLAARLLRLAGATTDAATIIARADLWAKAMIDKLARSDITRSGWDANNGDPPARTNSTAYTLGTRRRPSSSTGRVYEVVIAGTTASSPPTWPTTLGGTVTDGTVTWKYRKSNKEWVANTAYALGDVVKPTSSNSRTYRCTTAGTSHASTEPTWPTSAGGTVSDNGIVWKETTSTGGTFCSIYNPTSPYAAATTYDYDANQPAECAAAYALLMIDPDSAFYSAGAYRTEAQDIVSDIADLARAYGCSDGRFPIGDPIPYSDGRVMFDTLYGGGATQWYGLIYRRNASVTTELQYIIGKAADWMIAEYSTEPLSHAHYAGDTNIQSNEVAQNLAGIYLTGRSSSVIENILFTAAFIDTATGKQTYYTPNGGGTARPNALQFRYLDGRAAQYAALTDVLTRTVTADAVVKPGRSITADAMIANPTTRTVTAEALIASRLTATVTSDAHIVSGTAVARTTTFTADASIVALAVTTTRAFTSDALISTAAPETPPPDPSFPRETRHRATRRRRRGGEW